MLLPYSRAAVHLLLVGLLVSVAACVPVNVSAAARTRFAEATVRNRDSVYGEQRREYVRRVSGRRASKPADSEDAEGGEGDGGADGVVGKRKRKGKPTAQSEDAGGVSGSDESKGKPEMDPEDGGDATDPDNGREGKKKNKEPAPEDDGTQEGEEGKDDGGDEDGDDSATDDGKGDASDSGAENAPDASTSGQNSSEGGGAPKTTADNNPNTDTKDAPNDRGPASDDGNNSKSPRSITPRLPSPPSVGGSSFFTAPKSVIGMIGGGVFALVAILVLANTSVCGRGRAEDQPYEPVENANAGQAGFAEGEEVSGWNDGWGQDEWEEGTEAKV